MTGQLPQPGSIWRQQCTGRTMRVILSGSKDIVCHDCELSDRMPVGINPDSWRGTLEEFSTEFLPSSYEYPKTAG